MFNMNIDKDFLIQFTGLKNGEHTFEFQIDKSFFEAYNNADFNHINATTTVLLNKKTNLLELKIFSKGAVNIPCDVTNQDFDMPIESQIDLIVKFGEKFNDELEDVLIVSYTEHQINLAQYIYEMILLSIPYKRVHPGVLDGTLDSEALDILGYKVEEEELDDELSLLLGELDDLVDDEEENDEDEEVNENIEIDPRWAELKKLLTDK